MKKRLWLLAGVGAAIVAIGPLASSASAAGHAVSHKVSDAQTRAALKYWTPQRMKNAVPLDIVRPGAPAPTSTASAPTGAPGFVAPMLPNGQRTAPALMGGLSPFGFAYPFPYTRFEVWPTKSWKKFPYVLNGKVFFTQNGGNFVCSGTSVYTASGNTVWLAGHCVNNGAGIWDSSAVFVPAYNGNAANVAPKGIWTATNFASWSTWVSGGDFARDLGLMTVANDSHNHTLASKIGSAGFAWNWGRDQEFVDFGYPQAAPFDGTSMYECNAATAVYDSGSPQPIGIGCDMTGGSSGGSWNRLWSQAGGGYINGHNDYKYGSQPEAMYSPYFDDAANTVRCIIATC